MCWTDNLLSNSWQLVFYQSADKINEQIVAAVVSNNSDMKWMNVMIVVN